MNKLKGAGMLGSGNMQGTESNKKARSYKLGTMCRIQHLFPCIVTYIKRVTLCFVSPLMKTTTWLSKRLAIINQFWLVKSGNRFNMSTPSHKGFFAFSFSNTLYLQCMIKDYSIVITQYHTYYILHSTVRMYVLHVLQFIIQPMGACTHLAFDFPIQQDVPCSQVSVDKPFV